MRFFRYRRPSLKTVLGITKAKKTLKRKTGLTAATKPWRAVTNLKRRVKRKAGYYSPSARAVRQKRLRRPWGL